MSATKTPPETGERRKRGRPRRVGPKPPAKPKKRPKRRESAPGSPARALAPTKNGARYPRWWRPYLRELERNGGFKDAAKAAIGISRNTPLAWFTLHPDRREEFECLEAEAIDRATDAMLAEAKRRGQDGYEEPIFYQGKKTRNKVRRFSDTLLMFTLNARGRGTRAPVQLNVDLSKLTDDQLRRIAEGEDPVAVVAGAPE